MNLASRLVVYAVIEPGERLRHIDPNRTPLRYNGHKYGACSHIIASPEIYDTFNGSQLLLEELTYGTQVSVKANNPGPGECDLNKAADKQLTNTTTPIVTRL